MYTRVQHRNCKSGLTKTCCTQAGPAHAAGYVQSTLAIFSDMHYR